MHRLRYLHLYRRHCQDDFKYSLDGYLHKDAKSIHKRSEEVESVKKAKILEEKTSLYRIKEICNLKYIELLKRYRAGDKYVFMYIEENIMNIRKI